MARVALSQDFPAGVEKLWAILSDPSRYGEWLGMHKQWKGDPPSSLTQGAQLPPATVSLINMPNTFVWTVENVEAPRSYELSATGMAGVKVNLTITVVPAESGSTLTMDGEFTGAMITGALARAVEQAVTVDINESFSRLAELAA
ncbi:SRPBCC family protein [Nocardia yamanashiensis]|uniref:type II toxin-antitoxin system Rv0910 family toxin n=1 Tax=Nocardia yamanashiensis TaxID=209247 RepID=UPI001E48B03A|nr:SRPBCC family protein [Nocardia yamanashiensis]UGT38848.1 SRPBCC family protein [Nocardia yamanashiensis]